MTDGQGCAHPIDVMPSTRRAHLEATASSVRFLAQFGLCGAKNPRVAAKIFGCRIAAVEPAQRVARTLVQPSRRRTHAKSRNSCNAKNKAFSFSACSRRCSRCVRDARDGCLVAFRPRACGVRADGGNPPGVVDSGKNRD